MYWEISFDFMIPEKNYSKGSLGLQVLKPLSFDDKYEKYQWVNLSIEQLLVDPGVNVIWQGSSVINIISFQERQERVKMSNIVQTVGCWAGLQSEDNEES